MKEATTHMKCAHMGVFHVYGWKGIVLNTKNVPKMAHFLCFVIVKDEELSKHKKQTYKGVFFVFGEKEWEWGC